MAAWSNPEFELGGVNHLALVCSDMERTVQFYTEVLGMRLVKTIDLPDGAGQHFFFDMGGGILLEFACWLRELAQPGDLGREPRTAADRVAKV